MVRRGHTSVYRGVNDASSASVDRLRAFDADARHCATTLPLGPPEERYRDCAATAGAAPLFAGDPGYSREFHGNDDGVACEQVRSALSP